MDTGERLLTDLATLDRFIAALGGTARNDRAVEVVLRLRTDKSAALWALVARGPEKPQPTEARTDV